jgi:nucleoside-diphosphate-sugar epimerase
MECKVYPDSLELKDIKLRTAKKHGCKNVNYTASKAGNVRHSLADVTLARRLLGYEPKVMVKEGLRQTVEAFIADQQQQATGDPRPDSK